MFELKKDGSIDMNLGGIALKNAYPAINSTPVRPISVKVENNYAVFDLVDGRLEIKLTGNEILCRVTGMNGIHDISPIADAHIIGCTKAFKQGLGIGGPSGFIDINDTFDSDALVAVGDDESCITLHASDNSRYRIHYHGENRRLSASIDLEGTDPGDIWLPAIKINTGADFSAALRACSADIAQTMRARTPSQPAFHWCSWYYLYHCLDQQTLEEYLEGFNKYRDIAPFRYIQIDAGYFPSCGDWLEYNPRFPKGLKGAADAIKAAGYEPGIWIGPFMVGEESKLFKEHPDWMLSYTDGSYVIPWKQYNEPKPWGYRDNHFYVLDTSHPDAMAYIKNVFVTLRSMGFTMYKTDFLLWGLKDSSKVLRHTPGKTSFEYFREFLTAVREAIGEESQWLGCIAPFMPAIGYVDMMRIGGDVGAQWEENGFGPVNMIQEIHADQYFSNVYWQNDPDAVLLRDFHIHLKPHQIEALAILQAMSGGVITTSDPVHEIAEDRRRLLELIRPSYITRSNYPYWQEKRDEEIITADTKSGKLAYFFNPTPKSTTVPCDWKKLLGDTNWHLFRLHGTPAHAEKVPYVIIPAQSGVLFFASREELMEEPRNMWEW